MLPEITDVCYKNNELSANFIVYSVYCTVIRFPRAKDQTAPNKINCSLSRQTKQEGYKVHLKPYN